MRTRILLSVLCITLLTAGGGCSKSEQPAEKTEQATADAARNHLQAQAQAGVAKLLERVVAVLDGYQAFSGHYPQQFEDLNQGDYFFDLAYLTDLVAPPFKAYILLGGSAQPYRVWVVDGKNKVAMEQVAGGAPRTLPAAALGDLEREFQPRSLAANVIGLAPRAAAKGGAG
ncbi:hypothetical protein DBW_3083 [Desulfuromonas sp. DDH964]|uniref:hypothetical protein n=1 Tax=Desulfuromonas sp. DDH964 TaxID=1823759 RepID=UPI00078E5F29|nr:hypothetical protein [Desulfuromonas sp. DDH964]AMV73391.1 hypothetical protein DBW_3083 [Desulfuromonas sp. DDH964]